MEKPEILKLEKLKYTDTLEIATGLILTSTLVEDVAYSSFAEHGYIERRRIDSYQS